MNGMEFLDKLEHIDPAYVAEAERTAPAKRRRLPRWGLALAACLGLLVSAGAALEVSGYGTRLLHTFTARPEESNLPGSGYVIETKVELFPVSAFTGEVREAEADLLAQYERWYRNWEEFANTYGEDFASWLEQDPELYSFAGSYKRDFATAQEALDYIGFAGLRSPDMGLEETAVWSCAIGGASGQLQSVSFVVQYTAETLRMETSALIFTENHPTYSSTERYEYFPEELLEGASEGGIVLFTQTDEDVSYTEDFYTTAAGGQCRILQSSVRENGYHYLSGYLVVDGVLYGATIPHLTEDADQAMELLHRWADGL